MAFLVQVYGTFQVVAEFWILGGIFDGMELLVELEFEWNFWNLL